MCSIVGGTLSKAQIERASAQLAHRGPDAHAIFADENVVLAHNRLAIIDLTEAANQPMIQENLVLVFNGEIYNFQEIRKKLEARNIQFKTQSDTEVILHSYFLYGTDCVKEFNGDFAFCIYDQKKQQLFCARDRVGNKPFYYSCPGSDFIFASELKAFPELMDISFNNSKVGDALLFAINDNDDQTILKGVQNLLPGHTLCFDLQTRKCQIKAYWELPDRVEETPFDETQLELKLQEFEELFTDAVRLRLIADVPVGCLLSGGLDSSLVAYFIKQLGGDVHFFSVIHPHHPGIDETHFIKIIEKELEITGTLAEPAVENLKSDWLSLIHAQDDLFRSLAIYNGYFILKQAKGKVKVMLSGQGADELCGGYYHHVARILWRRPGQVWARAKRVGWKQTVKELKSGVKFSFPDSLKKKILQKDNRKALSELRRLLPEYQPDWPLLLEKFTSDIRLALRRDTLSTNLPQLLRFEDRNAMAHSIENRTPFTDYRVIEFFHCLPTAFLFRKGFNKYFLRRFGERFLPKEIAWRVDKVGFEAPDQEWMAKISPNHCQLPQFRQYLWQELAKLYQTARGKNDHHPLWSPVSGS